MGVRRAGLVVALLLVPAAAGAGDHKFDAYVAGSYLGVKGSWTHLGGWHVSGAATAGPRYRKLSFVGDLSVHFLGGDGTDLSTDLTQVTFMVGPRWTPFGGGLHHHHMLFVQAMPFGAVLRTSEDAIATAASAFAVGLGYEWAPGEGKTWGGRVEVDWVQPWSSDLSGSLRVSVGGIYRFH